MSCSQVSRPSHQSVVLMGSRFVGVCVFEWATTDHVFKVNMPTSGAPFRERPGIISHIMFPLNESLGLVYMVFTMFTQDRTSDPHFCDMMS